MMSRVLMHWRIIDEGGLIMEMTANRQDTHVDRYPSRTRQTPSVTARLDPVVYGTVSSGPLDEQALKLYSENGFLHFDSLLDADELAVYLNELGRLCADPSIKDSPEAVIEPDSGELRSIFAVHEVSTVMRSLCGHPKLVAIAKQLLGSDVYLHQSRINYKGGFHGKEFFWHSDFETWHVEDGLPAMRAVSCSISLTPNTPHNGPLMLIPGSHHRFIACVGKTPEDHYQSSLRRQEVGVPDEKNLTKLFEDFGVVAPTGPVGSVTFFECNVMHGSNSNITPLPRSNVFVVYNSVDNKPLEPFCGLAARPNFIAERKNFVSASTLSVKS